MNLHKPIGAMGLSLLLGLAISAQAAEPAKPAAAKSQAVPADASAKKACTTSDGATKAECEKVAAKIDAHTANPQANPIVEPDRPPAEDIHHSSPVMVTPEEKAASDATRRELQKEKKAKEAAAEKPKE
jgi:hypothetical protein